MRKKSVIALVLALIIFLLCLVIFLYWWFRDDGESEFEIVGIERYFEYDNKEIIKNIFTWTGKEEILYKYYYSEEKEKALLDNIKKHGNWHEIENMDNTNFYFEYDIQKVSKGYLYFYNFDYHNKVFDAYDYYNNIKLGGTVSQYYRICVIDIEKNVIWFYETERII